jgi:hypothetical protein
VATFILQKILLDETGLSYICQTYERFSHVAMILVRNKYITATVLLLGRVGGNPSARRKPTTFGRALTDSVRVGIEPTNSEVKGACCDECAPEAPLNVQRRLFF